MRVSNVCTSVVFPAPSTQKDWNETDIFFFKHVCFLSITPNKEVREFELDTNIPLRYRVTLMEAFLVS